MESGQPPHFLWTRDGGGYWREIAGRKIVVKQNGNALNTRPKNRKHVHELLRSQDDLRKIYSEIATDAAMERAIGKFRGMRLTKNGEWETLVSYICSQNSNIKRIRNNVRQLSRNGEVMPPEEIAAMDLRKANLGYREAYLKQASKMVADGEFDLLGLRKLSYGDAHDELQRLPGIGPKVADCVLLYGFGELEAFPLDVWVGRAMQNWYGVKTQKQVADFACKRWGKLAGYAQQYLFMLAREELAVRPNKHI